MRGTQKRQVLWPFCFLSKVEISLTSLRLRYGLGTSGICDWRKRYLQMCKRYHRACTTGQCLGLKDIFRGIFGNVRLLFIDLYTYTSWDQKRCSYITFSPRSKQKWLIVSISRPAHRVATRLFVRRIYYIASKARNQM